MFHRRLNFSVETLFFASTYTTLYLRRNEKQLSRLNFFALFFLLHQLEAFKPFSKLSSSSSLFFSILGFHERHKEKKRRK